MTDINEKIKVTGTLNIKLTGPDGKVKMDYTTTNTVVTDGLIHIADQMSGKVDTAMSHMAIGTDDTPPGIGQHTLVAEVFRKVLTSKVQSTSSVIYICLYAAGEGTATIKEAGILNNAAGGTMLCRALVLPTVPKGLLDTLTITWTLAFS